MTEDVDEKIEEILTGIDNKVLSGDKSLWRKDDSIAWISKMTV